MHHGRGLQVALMRTLSSAEAVVMAEDHAGGLVRRLGRWAQDHPEEWRTGIAEAEAAGVAVTVTVNDDILDDSAEVPDGLWRSFEIECWRRDRARTGAEVANSLVDVGGPALAVALGGILEHGPEGDLPRFEPLPEGAATTVLVNRYERNPINRVRCISHYGSTCWACDFDFGKCYGSAAEGYIEVHHRVPVSQVGESYRVDPIRDLVPLCSNCHSAAHRRQPPYEPWELRASLGLPVKSPALPSLNA
ncbi:HNH endonuclease [Terrabacter sp. 2YAF2]|uniref:HNH endonuclease n=1 Tax=Terrabacter sp. 2YAF2 TaxID=3233026 RepID=UPI003F962CD5